MKGFSFIKRRIKVSLNWLSDVGVAGMNTHNVNNLQSQTQIQTFTHTHTYTRTHARIQSGAVRDREKHSSAAWAKRKRARKRLQGHKRRPTTGSCTYVARCASPLCSPTMKGSSGLESALDPLEQMRDSERLQIVKAFPPPGGRLQSYAVSTHGLTHLFKLT